MATKIIKAWIGGAIQNIEVEDIISPELPLSVEERLDTLEDKHEVVISDGNLLVGNGTPDLEELTPEEVLSHINGASIMTLTSEEFEALSDDEVNANTLYMLTDAEEETGNAILYTEQSLTEEQKLQARNNIGIGETIVDTLATLDLISTITDNDGSLAEGDGTLLVTRNDDIFLPEVTAENDGNVLVVENGKWAAGTIDIPEIPEINYPVTSVNGQTGDVVIDIPEGFSGSWNDLEDKPFGEESVSSRNTVYETTVDNTSGKLTYRILDYDIAPLNNRNVIVTVNGVEYESVCTFNGGSGNYSIALGDGVHYINQSVLNNNASITTLEATIYEIKIETVETVETIVPLNEKFIPDTIARVSASIPTPITASVGQTIIVKAIDESGKPTEWECVNIERPFMTQVTLTTANWNDSTKSQNVTVSGILSDTTAQNIQCNPIPASMYYAIESGLYCSAQADDALTFSCSVIPTEDITLNVVWQDVYYVS